MLAQRLEAHILIEAQSKERHGKRSQNCDRHEAAQNGFLLLLRHLRDIRHGSSPRKSNLDWNLGRGKISANYMP